MSHEPPMPKGSVSPYPLQAEQTAARAEARHELAEQTNIKPKPSAGFSSGRLAASAAIGSAAIAAAVIFWNRSKAD